MYLNKQIKNICLNFLLIFLYKINSAYLHIPHPDMSTLTELSTIILHKIKKKGVFCVLN